MIKRIVIINTILIFCLASCLVKEEEVNTNSESFRFFMRLQEDLVDLEEQDRLTIEKNIDLEKERSNLNHELERLAIEIEKKNHKKDFAQEKTSEELPNPKDRIKEEQIKITHDKVTLDIDNVYWGYMIDSNSMDPLLDEGTTILTIKPKSSEDIGIGDIIVFKSDLSEYNIVHRVHGIEKDEKGLYYRTKGDNNPEKDHIKIRFEDVIAVVVGILY